MKTKKKTPSKAKPTKPVLASPPAPAEASPPPPKSPAAKAAPHLYGRLLGIMRARGADYPTQSAEDFAAYAFSGLKPEGTAEVMLCAQMVACWEVGMQMLSGAKLADDYQAMTEKGNLAVKLLSIFERQFATLTKTRKPPQTVTVVHEHKHIHVSTPGPTGDEIRIEGQPHATDPRTTLAIAHGPALLSQDEARDAVPVASDEARPMPNARRRSGDRRTER